MPLLVTSCTSPIAKQSPPLRWWFIRKQTGVIESDRNRVTERCGTGKVGTGTWNTSSNRRWTWCQHRDHAAVPDDETAVSHWFYGRFTASKKSGYVLFMFTDRQQTADLVTAFPDEIPHGPMPTPNQLLASWRAERPNVAHGLISMSHVEVLLTRFSWWCGHVSQLLPQAELECNKWKASVWFETIRVLIKQLLRWQET